jgi:hypothetical protein
MFDVPEHALIEKPIPKLANAMPYSGWTAPVAPSFILRICCPECSPEMTGFFRI